VGYSHNSIIAGQVGREVRSGRAAPYVAAGVITRLSTFRMRRLGSERAAHVLAPKALTGAHIPGTRRYPGTPSHPLFMLTEMSDPHPFDDPVPRSVALSPDEAFRMLEAIEDARLALRERGAAPGLQDELATVIRMLHGKLGFDEGGVQ
jgi:hypothetical protein